MNADILAGQDWVKNMQKEKKSICSGTSNWSLKSSDPKALLLF